MKNLQEKQRASGEGIGEPPSASAAMNVETIREYFNDRRTVNHYFRAVGQVGLWRSEALLARRYWAEDANLLDLGCGAGRIAFGLWKLGYRNVQGADLADNMVAEAIGIAKSLGAPLAFRREDATRLSLPGACLDGVIFGFNGLMQIPSRDARLKAMGEVRRVLRPEGVFVFTTLDREDRLYREVFADEACFAHDVRRNPNLIDLGDRHFETEHGTTFMHVPRREEVEALLHQTGFQLVESSMRSELCSEGQAVRDFSEDCRFWVAKKPAV